MLDPCTADRRGNGDDEFRSIHHIIDTLARIERTLDIFRKDQFYLLQHMDALFPGPIKSERKHTISCHTHQGNDRESDANVSTQLVSFPMAVAHCSGREVVISDTQMDIDKTLEANSLLQPPEAHVSEIDCGSSRLVAAKTAQEETSASRHSAQERASAFVLCPAREDVLLGSQVDIHDEDETNGLRQQSQASVSAFVSSLESSQRISSVGSSLPSDWPQTVEIRDMGQNFHISEDEAKNLLMRTRLVTRLIPLESDAESRRPNADMLLMQRSTSYVASYFPRYLFRICCRRHGSSSGLPVLLPGSRAKVILDSMGVFLLLYDAVVTPFVLAWEIKIEGWFFVSSIIITIFWTLDMFCSSRLAYYTDGELETRPSIIAKQYLKTWFLFDVMIVGSDYMGVFTNIYNSMTPDSPEDTQDVQGPDSAFIRLLKSGRLMRMFGLVRLGRMRQFLNHLFGEFEIGFALYDMTKLMACLVWFIHIVGCVWFMMRASEEDLEEDMAQQYSSVVLWSTTTLLSGGTYIIPSSIPQRFLACICVLLGLLFLSYFVSQLSSTAMELKMMQEEKARYIFTLDRFLRHHHLRRELASLAHMQVKAYLDHRSKAMLKVHQVPALDFLSGHLRTSISIELCRPHLYCHQFFTIWTISDNQFVESICAQAIDFTNLLPTYELFHAGTKSTRAFLMIKGMALYTQESGTSRTDETVDVESSVWICEASLWTHWVHVGKFRSIRFSEIVSLDGDATVSLIEKSPILNEIALEYATQFHLCVCSSHPPTKPWPSDIKVHGVEFTHLLRTSLSLNARNIVGLATVEEIKTNPQFFFVAWAARNLAKEVQLGKSILYVVSNGRRLHVERGVSLVRVRVVRGDGRILSNIAEKCYGEQLYQLKLAYPGTKQRYNEMIPDAVERIMKELRHFIGDVEFVSTETTSEAGHSTKFEIGTRYSISTYNYELQVDINSPFNQSSLPRRGNPMEILQRHLLSPSTGVSRRDDSLIFHAWLSEDEFKLMKDIGHRADGLVQTAAAGAEAASSRACCESESGSEFTHPGSEITCPPSPGVESRRQVTL